MKTYPTSAYPSIQVTKYQDEYMADYSVNMPPISHPPGPGPNSSDFRSSEPFSSSNNSRGGAYQDNHTSGTVTQI